MKKVFTISTLAVFFALAALISPAKADGLSFAFVHKPTVMTFGAAGGALANGLVQTSPFLIMVVGCEVRYKTTGKTCGDPGPAPLGYNQLRGLAPRPDGTTHADY